MRAFAIVLCALAPAAMWAADVTGKWEAKTETPRGEMTMTFDLTVDGDTVTGTVGNDRMGETEIEDGKIDGDKISFKQVMTMGDRSMTVLYEGTFTDDTLTLERKMERPGGGRGPGPGARGQGSAGGPGGGGRGPRGPQTLTATRVQ